MGKFLSWLSKNENNTDIQFYQIYLFRLHENILKYYRLNLFNEVAIGINHCLRMILESLVSLSNSLFD